MLSIGESSNRGSVRSSSERVKPIQWGNDSSMKIKKIQWDTNSPDGVPRIAISTKLMKISSHKNVSFSEDVDDDL